jgi:hypothetical protein
MNVLKHCPKVGDVFRTTKGWWVRITEVSVDKIEGYFGCDEVSIEWPICLVAGYRAIWDRVTGKEITDPKKPCDWLALDSAEKY